MTTRHVVCKHRPKLCKNMCSNCYSKNNGLSRVGKDSHKIICPHKDRAHKAQGLCQPCYMQKRNSPVKFKQNMKDHGLKEGDEIDNEIDDEIDSDILNEKDDQKDRKENDKRDNNTNTNKNNNINKEEDFDDQEITLSESEFDIAYKEMKKKKKNAKGKGKVAEKEKTKGKRKEKEEEKGEDEEEEEEEEEEKEEKEEREEVLTKKQKGKQLDKEKEKRMEKGEDKVINKSDGEASDKKRPREDATPSRDENKDQKKQKSTPLDSEAQKLKNKRDERRKETISKMNCTCGKCIDGWFSPRIRDSIKIAAEMRSESIRMAFDQYKRKRKDTYTRKELQLFPLDGIPSVPRDIPAYMKKGFIEGYKCCFDNIALCPLSSPPTSDFLSDHVYAGDWQKTQFANLKGRIDWAIRDCVKVAEHNNTNNSKTKCENDNRYNEVCEILLGETEEESQRNDPEIISSSENCICGICTQKRGYPELLIPITKYIMGP